MQVLFIWFPNWPIQRLLATEPALAERAVVLETRDPRRGLLVAAANYSARQAGAVVGMRMSELAAIKTPDDFNWEVREYQPHLDLDALCDLAEQAQQFSPIVGLEPVESQAWHGRTSIEPQGLVLDASGIPSLFGGPSHYLEAICAWLESKRFFAYMSLSSTLGCAWACANFEITKRSREKNKAADSKAAQFISAQSMPAHASNQTSSPVLPASEYLITEPWEEAELLSELPVAALRIDSITVSKLQRLGVRTLNQLWQLPRDGLASRLGSQLLLRSDHALGVTAETIVALHAHPDWCCELAIEHPTISQDVLSEILQQLTDQLARQLSKAGQGALRCVCRLDLVRRPALVMQLGLFAPSDEAAHLHFLLAGQLEQVLGSLQTSNQLSQASRRRPTSLAMPASLDEEGAVCRVNLQATLVAPMVWQQTQLFDQSQWRQKQQLARLIDTLSGRLGRDSVVEASLKRDAEPDQAVAYRPLTGRRRDGTAQDTVRKVNSRLASSGAEPSASDPLRRPNRLLKPPELLASIQLDGDGRLIEFVYENARHQATSHWGPERLESGWWRGPSLRRDYYRIETQSGAWWWIYKDLATGQWYLHGVFA